jgi:hypothetical protein
MRATEGKDQGALMDLWCWASNAAGPKVKEKGGKEEGLPILERDQTNKFKFELEFQQTNAMHQHECNKHEAIYLS